MTARTTAVLVTVAPLTASIPAPSITFPLFPMNCFVNASSAHRVPIPGVCVSAFTVIDVIAPFSSSVSVTITSPSLKPAFVAVHTFAPSGGSGMGISSGFGSAIFSRSFTVRTTTELVTVAPLTVSISRPSASSPLLPLNWLRNGSSMHS